MLALLVIINCKVTDMETCEEGLSALYRLLSSPEATLDSADSLADTLALCLANHVSEAEVVEVVFGCMRVCASKFPCMQTLLGREGVVESLLRAMSCHVEGEETVQEQGCLVICELARNSEANTRLLRSLHCEKALERAARLITNERNKVYPTLAREVLGLKK